MKDEYKEICSLNYTQSELRQRVDYLDIRDWFYVSLVRKLDKDFIRQFEDKIDLNALVHRYDMPKEFLYEMVDKKDTDKIINFIVSNQTRFCDFVNQIYEYNKEMFTDQQKLTITITKDIQ